MKRVLGYVVMFGVVLAALFILATRTNLNPAGAEFVIVGGVALVVAPLFAAESIRDGAVRWRRRTRL
jgi:hypothetical protein